MKTIVILASALCMSFAANGARAHAFLDHAEPGVGSTVQTAPRELALSFTESLEPAFTTVEVTDGNGAKVDQGKARVTATTMRIRLKPLSPGTYTVRWHALSVDTHKTEGSFSFHVGH
jgi:methionine-rich copper-binding protein CopC